MNLPFDPGVTGVTFKNTTGGSIPPHGVMAVQGMDWNETEQSFWIKVAKPTQTLIDDNSLWAFNGPTAVGDGKTGKCYFALHQGQWAAIDEGLTYADVNVVPPALELGPIADQWYLGEDGTGMIVLGAREDEESAGDVEKNRAMVIQKPPVAAGVFGFVILSVNNDDPEDIVATCQVTYRPCGVAKVFGEDDYGMVEVHDQVMQCLFNEEPADLVGRRGHAAAQYPDESERIDYPECRNQALGLCCAEEEA